MLLLRLELSADDSLRGAPSRAKRFAAPDKNPPKGVLARSVGRLDTLNRAERLHDREATPSSPEGADLAVLYLVPGTELDKVASAINYSTVISSLGKPGPLPFRVDGSGREFL